MPKKKVTEAVEETAQETIPVEKAPAQMPRRQGSEDLLELNDLERGVTREDSEEAKWGYLAGAVRRQQILTGIVSAGMTYTENGMPIVPIDFEGLCVKIPVREMTLIEWPEDEPIPRSVRVQIGRMLGATIDFIPAGVDFKERVAIGSRKAAMLQRQKRYYASGRVKPGILMACRVLTVGNNTMMVEACGVDTEIYARNVSWEWFSDIADLHSTGDLVVARVLDVTYNEQRDTYAVNLSIKDASENPDRAALEKIVPNSNYFGVVTGVKDRVFFVRLQAGVNAKTKLYRSIDMPSRLDTVSFRVTRVDEENGIALGFITRIIKRHTRLRYPNMNYSPSSRDAIDEHCREVIRSCLNIVEQHGDTYVAIHKDDDIECIVLVSMIRSYPILSIIVADKLLLADINAEQMHSIANELNLVSVTGWHSVFLADDSMIYMYRQCLWLSMSLTYEDLLTMLKECISEYKRGKGRLTTGEYPTDPVA